METLEQLKEIVKNSPEGTNYVTKSNKYLMVQGGLVRVFNNMSVWSVPICNAEDVFLNEKPRLLSDIKLIIELMELNQNMHTTVAGYLWGKDWAHWNEFNAGKFKL